MGIVNTEFKRLTVREVMIWGTVVFPNATTYDNWPQVDCSFNSLSQLEEIVSWCDLQFGHDNWFRIGKDWLFTDTNAATLFKLTWT